MYKPRFASPDWLVLDCVFDAKDCLDYAVKHRFNVRYSDTGSSDVAKIMLKFRKKGFDIDVIGERVRENGLELAPKPIILFKYPQTDKEGIK